MSSAIHAAHEILQPIPFSFQYFNKNVPSNLSSSPEILVGLVLFGLFFSSPLFLLTAWIENLREVREISGKLWPAVIH